MYRRRPVIANVIRLTIPAVATKRHVTIFKRIIAVVLLAPVVALIVPLILVLLAAMLVYGVLLTVIVWLLWCTRGIDTLVVYSDSPNWHDYMTESVMPKLQDRSIVLNWSERRHWRSFSLSVAVFRFFGGDRQYNRIVVVLRPFRVPRTFRFWQPFRDRKHGNLAPLNDLECKLYSYLELNAQPNGG